MGGARLKPPSLSRGITSSLRRNSYPPGARPALASDLPLRWSPHELTLACSMRGLASMIALADQSNATQNFEGVLTGGSSAFGAVTGGKALDRPGPRSICARVLSGCRER
jgi:hypothetical protein